MKFNLSSPFNMVTFSSWPFLSSLSLMYIMAGMVKMFIMMKMDLVILGFILSFIVLYQWWRDVIRESTYQGQHSKKFKGSLRFGFALFVISEVLFFISFFWSLFHMMLSPPVEVGAIWPCLGVITFDPMGIPMLNSFILITSGMTVTAAHHFLMMDMSYKSSMYLLITIVLGLIFTMFQWVEYEGSSFTIADSCYGSLFYVMTGFHGLHVMVGTIFLTICYYRMIKGHFISYHHLGFEMAVWYWHFVDVVWLFLYISVYWWCSN